MNDDDRQRPYAPPDSPEPSRAGESARAKAIAEALIGTARASAKGTSGEQGSRSPLAKALRVLTILAALSAGITFLYGIYNFPDAPIRPSGSGYVGKSGKPHTAQDFERFVLWERAMFLTFPATFLFGFAYDLSVAGRRGKGKR